MWDGDGKCARDSYVNGSGLDTCHHLTQCCLFEMSSYCGKCDHRIIIDSEVAKERNTAHDAFRIDVHFLSNLKTYGDIDRAFHCPG